MDAIFFLMTIIMLLKSMRLDRSVLWVNMNCPSEHDFGLTETVTAIFLLIFFVATMLGFFRYHYWQTIFTEAKVGLYFGAIPLIADVFRKGKIRLETFLLFLVVASTLGCIYDLYARIYDVYTISAFTGGEAGVVSYADTAAGEIVRDYGWGSTFIYQVFSVLICFAFLLKTKRTLLRLGWLGLLSINLLSNLLTVTRGYMVGLLIGLPAVIYLSNLAGSASQGVLWGKLIGRATIAVLVLFGILSAMVYTIPQTSAAFERFYGLYDRNYAGYGDESNEEYRLKSVETGLSSALEYPFGVGYGYLVPSTSLSVEQERIRSLVYHNSLGFMLYKFGFPGTVTTIGIFAVIIVKLFSLIRREEKADKRALICIMSSLLALLSMSITSTNWLFDHSSLLPFIVAIIAGGLSNVDSLSVAKIT